MVRFLSWVILDREGNVALLLRYPKSTRGRQLLFLVRVQARVLQERQERMNANVSPAVTGQASPMPPLCRGCRKVIQPDFKYCPHCGQRQDQGQAWYYHPLFILVIALTVAGPLVLPLVWRSQRMRIVGKTVMTVAILAYTAYACYLCYQVVVWELSFTSELGNMMRQVHPR